MSPQTKLRNFARMMSAYGIRAERKLMEQDEIKSIPPNFLTDLMISLKCIGVTNQDFVDKTNQGIYEWGGLDYQPILQVVHGHIRYIDQYNNAGVSWHNTDVFNVVKLLLQKEN